MRKTTNRILALIGAAIISLTAASCGNTSTAKTTKSESTTAGHTADKVVMTYVTSPLNVPAIIAKNKGTYEAAFKKLGVSMTYTEITSGADQTAALASGDVQILGDVGDTSIIISAAGGADIKIIGAFARCPEAMRILSKDSSIKSPADLKGKTIAGPKGTTLNQLLVAYLKSGGLTLSDVNYVSMDIPSAKAALEGGSVDAALLAGPNAYTAEKEGMHVVTTGKGYISAVGYTACTQKFYNSNKAIIDAYIAAQKSNLSYIKKNYEECMEITAKETSLDLSAVKEMYPMYDFSTTVTDDDIKALADTEEFLYDSGMISTHVDTSKLILNTD